MKINKVIVVDWLDKYAGSERVISSITKLFDFKACYTLVNNMSANDLDKTFSNKVIAIEQSFLKYFKNKFRVFFALFPLAIKSLKISKNTQLIVSSSHSIAKGIQTSRSQLHICYFQARNQKYIWDDVNLYFGNYTKLIFPIIKYLRKIDVQLAKNPNYIIANSFFVKNWIQKTYNIHSTVIYPPVDLQKFTFEPKKDNYFIAVGRLEKYKRFDLLVKTFNKLKKKLIIIGDGTELKKLEELASDNILFLGYLSTEKVNNYLKKAKAFVHIGIEDFGIAPVEAQACGTPVIAFESGGICETVENYKTGILFNKQTVDCIEEAITKFEQLRFNPEDIRKNAEKFSKERFEREFKEYVDLKIKEFYN